MIKIRFATEVWENILCKRIAAKSLPPVDAPPIITRPVPKPTTTPPKTEARNMSSLIAPRPEKSEETVKA